MEGKSHGIRICYLRDTLFSLKIKHRKGDKSLQQLRHCCLRDRYLLTWDSVRNMLQISEYHAYHSNSQTFITKSPWVVTVSGTEQTAVTAATPCYRRSSVRWTGRWFHSQAGTSSAGASVNLTIRHATPLPRNIVCQFRFTYHWQVHCLPSPTLTR